MFLVFAGVSILTAAALVFDDAYSETTQTVKAIPEPHLQRATEENEDRRRKTDLHHMQFINLS